MTNDTEARLESVRVELAQLPQDVVNRFIELWQRHSYSAHLNAHHSLFSPFGSRFLCSKTDLLLLSGRGRTDGVGRETLSIDPLLCGAVREDSDSGVLLVMRREPQVVATAVGRAPVIVTVVTHSTLSQPGPGNYLADRDGNYLDSQSYLKDVFVDVSTWMPDNSPAANIDYSWICTIEAVRLLYVGG